MPLPTTAFDPTKTVSVRKTFARFTPNLPSIAVSGANATDLFTATAHGLNNDDMVSLAITAGLTGVTAGYYFVVNKAADTFQLSLTKGGTPANFTADGTGTVKRVADLVGKMLDYDNKFETKSREAPDSDGYLRADRTVVTKREQTFKFESEDVKAVSAIFASTTIEGAFQDGTVELFVIDPADATGKVSVHCRSVAGGAFKASWQVDGGMKFAIGEFAKLTIAITALEKVILAPDASVT
ncbi:MAG TPA: hypothetical protein PKI32_06510 [Opitutales bacterium]|nr:hypothetical protein [Opitutales bacterium]